MTAPLEHMLRNAVAHGIESPAQRKSANKPEEGAIAIAMRREGSEVVLEIATTAPASIATRSAGARSSAA